MKLRKILRNTVAGVLLAGSSLAVQADFIDQHVDGFYYEATADPASRRGLGVQYLPIAPELGVLFVAYYTFDEDTGEPFWLVGNDLVEAGEFSLELDLIRLSGGSFGDVIGTPTEDAEIFGTGTVTFNACNDITWAYAGTGATAFSNNMTSTLNIVGGVANSACAYQQTFQGCPAFAAAGAAPRTCIISAGEYTEDLTLTNDTLWVLLGAVYIGARDSASNSNTLTIEPGTRIIGGAPDTLLGIQRGAKIMAEGTPYAPIVFTGPNTASSPEFPGAPADWGGLTINGTAPLNTCDTPGACTSEGEGESGTYGGDDPFDNSGVLRYVRVQFGGRRFNDTNELNGIAFQGVGAGTVVENVQVHGNEDDGMEFFGGTVNVRNVVLTDIKDDSLDWTEGWTGRVQNALVLQSRDFDATEVADRGIEADNLEGNNGATPQAKPWIANATFIGRPDTTGATFRRGTGVNLTNVLFTGFSNCLDIDDDATFAAAGTPADSLSGSLTIQNSIVDCNTNFVEEAGDTFTVQSWFEADGSNMEMAANLEGVFPPADASYLNGFEIDYTIFDSFFNNYGHVGAFSGADNAWTQGWTLQEFDFVD
jgi:hypothetical protein